MSVLESLRRNSVPVAMISLFALAAGMQGAELEHLISQHFPKPGYLGDFLPPPPHAGLDVSLSS